jgi:hypothetical protein
MSERIGGYLASREVLLIIDDVWKVEDAALFLLGGPCCATVITTRIPTVADNLSSQPDDTYKLDVLTENDAVELLESLAPDVVRKYEEECRKLACDLEFLPLALQVAGRLLRIEFSRTGDVKHLFQRLQDGKQQVLMEANVPTDVHALVGEKAPTVQALLRLTTDLLDEETRERFIYLGGFVPKPALVTRELLALQWDVEDPMPTIRKLLDFGLLERLDEKRYQIHAVLKAHALSLCDEE